MSSSLNNNIYTSIDIRFQNYPSSLIKKAIKRQGFILDELMQREIKTFYPTKEEMPSNDAMINQAANIEKIIQLKASHYEKRRLEKIDAVLYESKLLLQNPNLQPHRHLAAADSHKIINGGNSPSISDAINSNKSLNRHISSSYLSAGYSAVTYLKEKRPEDGGDDKKNYNDNNQGMMDNDDDDVEDFILPEGIEIPDWLDIDGDGEISQEEFEVFFSLFIIITI